MRIPALSASSENYVKAVWTLREWSDEPVTASTLAAKTGVRLSSASDAIRKLADQGLFIHSPYGAVELTADGERVALELLRRHRLIEAFLVEVLGYGLDEVHAEAEVLEHCASELMIERIDAHLGRPSRDPHGDPIPGPDGKVERPGGVALVSAEAGARLVVERIADGDSDLVRYLAERGVRFGEVVVLGDRAPFSGDVDLLVEASGRRVRVGRDAAEAIRVRPLPSDS